MKELKILIERVDRCKACLTRWVDNPSLTKNAACLLAVKIVCEDETDFSAEREQTILGILHDFLKQYISKEFEYRRKESK